MNGAEDVPDRCGADFDEDFAGFQREVSQAIVMHAGAFIEREHKSIGQSDAAAFAWAGGDLSAGDELRRCGRIGFRSGAELLLPRCRQRRKEETGCGSSSPRATIPSIAATAANAAPRGRFRGRHGGATRGRPISAATSSKRACTRSANSAGTRADRRAG